LKEVTEELRVLGAYRRGSMAEAMGEGLSLRGGTTKQSVLPVRLPR